MENIIVTEVSQTQKAKTHIFSLICGIQVHQYYETLVTLKRGHAQEGWGKKNETKNLNMVSILCIQE
jgi:hypothetical protein